MKKTPEVLHYKKNAKDFPLEAGKPRDCKSCQWNLRLFSSPSLSLCQSCPAWVLFVLQEYSLFSRDDLLLMGNPWHFRKRQEHFPSAGWVSLSISFSALKFVRTIQINVLWLSSSQMIGLFTEACCTLRKASQPADRFGSPFLALLKVVGVQIG